MDVTYSRVDGKLTISFSPSDIAKYSLLFELVIEDEFQMGTRVPDLKKAFFKKFSNSKQKVSITFSCDHLEFCLSFLEEVCIEMLEEGEDTEAMECLLDELGPLYCYSDTVH